MNICVIMHNMIIKSECANLVHDDFPYDWEEPLALVDHEVPAEFETFLQYYRKIRDHDNSSRTSG
jgi:hypothetical protein